MKDFFAAEKPRVFAHRGLSLGPSGDPLDENTLAAFAAAVASGVEYIETDVQASKDGVAVLFHDENLNRVLAQPISPAHLNRPISDFDWIELQGIELLNGGRIPSLEQALTAFDQTRFNLDFKVEAAVSPGLEVILRLDVLNRVLVSAFSEARRLALLSKLDQSQREVVATSAGSSVVLKSYLLFLIGLSGRFRKTLAGIDAFQIPTGFFGLNLASKSFIAALHRAGVEVHFWTINSTDEMRQLVDRGADGVVTDRADLAIRLFHSPK